jgi:hypothetical protein
MSTVITSTTTPARDDVETRTVDAAPETTSDRLWALSGLAAGVTGLGAIVATMGLEAVYDPAISGNADKILTAMADDRMASMVFHGLAASSALLLVPFAAGLARRLRTALPATSLLPTVAGIGLAMTAFVLIMGSGLDTEFAGGGPGKGYVVAENVSMYGHWIGTIPYLWTGAGLAGLALFGAFLRHRAVPRWIGIVGLVLGGLTVVAGVSPLEYMAGMLAPIWLLVTSTGFLVGDRAARR